MRAILPEPGWPGAEALGRSGTYRRWTNRASLLSGPDALLVSALLLLTVGFLAVLPKSFSVDSWLELAAGRLIWQVGVPDRKSVV